ncbi:MAG: glycosyltransferase, partial [Succinivibrio sp.]|nr:glycosyltransferase [Succinivibrio sp.]
MSSISKLNQSLDFKLRMMKLYSELRFPFSKSKRKQLRSLIEEKLCTKKIDFQVESSFDQNSVPIFIISYNRLSYVQQTIAVLEKYNLTNIHIIDNNSDYQPLLDYLGSLKYQVHFLKKNYGHRVLWDCEEFRHYVEDDLYIVTDPDLEFNPNLPKDFIVQLYKLLGSYP